MAEISLEGGLGLAPVKTDQRKDEEKEVQEGSTLEGCYVNIHKLT